MTTLTDGFAELLADVRAFLPELRILVARMEARERSGSLTVEDRRGLAELQASLATLHRALLEELVAGTPEAEMVRTLLGELPEARA